MTIVLTSTAFAHGTANTVNVFMRRARAFPRRSHGAARPPATRSFALIMDDPDAPMGTFVHWVIYNIPASSSGLPEAMPKDAKLPDGSITGLRTARAGLATLLRALPAARTATSSSCTRSMRR